LLEDNAATADVVSERLSQASWKTGYPHFTSALAELGKWIDPSIKV